MPTLSRRVARFNLRVTNPIQGTYAWLLPPWAVVVHQGRKSGRTYRTPVQAFKRGDTIAVAMFYGEGTQWARNLVEASGGQLVRGGRTYELREPRVVDVAEAGSDVPAPAQVLGRVPGKVFVARLGERRPGFGPGPAVV